MISENRILWLPAADAEERGLFDYETNSFHGASRGIPGVRIDADTALNCPIFLACVRVLAEGIASLPLHVYRRMQDGSKQIAREHPLYPVLHHAPNSWQTSFEWREQQMLHLCTHGQSFSEIIRGDGDIVSELIPLHPSRMKCERVETGKIRYTYQEESGRSTVYPQDQIMHIRWLSGDSVNGMVPVELAKDALGLAKACEVHGVSFFANGARPGLVLTTDNALNAETAERLRDQWERVHRGPDKASKTAVLSGGLKPVEYGSTNQESQFLEIRRFQIEEVCRILRVPPSLAGDLTRASFSNIEQQSIDYIQYTLMPWIRRFESAISRDLLGNSDVYFVEFDTRGMLRGDASARASYYSTLHGLGVASVNELRSWENLNPVEGGDSRFTPLNMQTLENAAKPPDEPPVANVSESVAILNQVASGVLSVAAAKSLMLTVFPEMKPETADQILAGVVPPKKDEPQQPQNAQSQPSADVGGLVTILNQIKDGSLSQDAAVAALGSVYPDLPPETALSIVGGVKAPQQPPQQPSADVGGLVAVLGLVSQGAVTPEAALSVVKAVYPAMPETLAQAIINGVKQQAPPPPEGGDQQPPPPDGGGQPPSAGGPDAAAAEQPRGFCPTGPGGGIDNSCGTKGPGEVSASDYGMTYAPGNAKVVAKARAVPDAKWNEIPVTTLPAGTKLQANEKFLKTAPIEKVVSGKEKFREGYVTKLWKADNGDLHIVDGHHRVAMYHALGKDMPVRIMDDKTYERLSKSSRAFCPTGVGGGIDNSCSSKDGGGGGVHSDVSVGALQGHADRVAGGSYVDKSVTSKDYPDGAPVPKDFEKLRTHHAETKLKLAARIDVADNKADLTNSAKTTRELHEDAKAVAKEFEKTVIQAARATGSEFSFGYDPKTGGNFMLKAMDSLEGKVPRIRARKGNEGLTDEQIVSKSLKDAVRGTIIADTPESLGDAVRAVRARAEKSGLSVAVQNKFLDQADPTGYGAVHMDLQMRTPDGRSVITELQFHLRDAYDGNQGSPKENSHGLYKPDPKTNSISRESQGAQMLIWSKAFDDVLTKRPAPKRKRWWSRAFCPTGDGGGIDNSCSSKDGTGGDGDSQAGDADVTVDKNGDGVTDVARVGVPAMVVPPPPAISSLPNLEPKERAAEVAFMSHFERDPDGVAKQYRDLVAKQGGTPTFSTDDAKALTDVWSDPNPDRRAENRATLNTPLHQTANAVAKRAFVQHLDTLKPGDEILVTVGGCGAGKGYALKNVPEALDMKSRAAVVWDSAGDQNATENPWVQAEAERRGLKVSYVYVHADPKTQWADPERGVVKRASDPRDGRMVDARVFADSYAIGARNHQAFYEANRNNPNASFVFIDNTGKPSRIDGIPRAALSLDSSELATFAERAVEQSSAPPRVKKGATQGRRIWQKKKT